MQVNEAEKPMLNDDEEARLPARMPVQRALDRMGIAELEEYIEALRAEIGRVEAELARKAGHMNAADSLFRKP